MTRRFSRRLTRGARRPVSDLEGRGDGGMLVQLLILHHLSTVLLLLLCCCCITVVGLLWLRLW